MSSFDFTRRNLIIGGGAMALAGCSVGTPNYERLDTEAEAVRSNLFGRYAPAKQAADNAAGYLIFPNITKAGFMIGGMTGEGALFSKENIIGHYSVKAASVGLQAGIQRFSMVLFFMTPEAMANFRASSGVELGTDIEYALPDYGSLSMGATSNTYRRPVYALIFNQGGVMIGASLKGAIYTAI